MRLPLPPQTVQVVVRWPRHLGHKTLFGISCLPVLNGLTEATETFLCHSDQMDYIGSHNYFAAQFDVRRASPDVLSSQYD
jgi:hypothetical protein